MSASRSSVLVVLLRDSEPERVRDRLLFQRSAPVNAHLVFINAYRQVPVDMVPHVGGVIIGGSALSVFERLPNADDLHALVNACRNRGVPMLGVCFGAQLIAQALGGEVIRDKEAEEQGDCVIRLHDDARNDLLLGDLPETFYASCAHQDRISCLPEGAVHLASSERCLVHAFRMHGTQIWGVQFHPERSETPEASSVIRTFVERAVLSRAA